MRKITILLLGCIYTTLFFGQPKGKTSYRYQNMDIDYNKDYNNANFIAEYIFTDALKLGDIYSQKITITDSLVTLKYTAPDFESNNDTDYKKVFIINPRELDSLKLVIKKANLKQLKPGIAFCQSNKCTREILIIKCDQIQIAGGQTYSSPDNYVNTEPDDIVEKKIQKDKKASSSIGGDYDSVVNILKKYFRNVEEPYKVPNKHKKIR